MSMNKRGFVDTEIVGHPAFVVLAALAISATLIGWMMGPKMGFEEAFPIWQLLVIIVVELIAAYVIVARSA